MSATSPVCALIRGSFDEYLRDALPAPQRRMLREHLSSCVECRSEAAGQDPTWIFARSSRDQVSDGDRERILSSVRTGVELLEAERRIARTRRRLTGRVAAAAAVAALVLLIPGTGGRAPSTEVALAPAGGSAAPRPAVTAAAGLQPAGWSDEPAPAASDAIIYDWNPGAGREEPRVVWIVDRGLDI